MAAEVDQPRSWKSRRSGFLHLSVLGLALGVGCWVARSRLLPLRDSGELEYVLLSPPWWSLFALVAVCVAFVYLVHLLAFRWLRGVATLWPRVPAGHPFPWWAPGLMAFSFLPLLNLLPELAGKLPVVTYICWDLRGLVVGLLFISVIVEPCRMFGLPGRLDRLRRDLRAPGLPSAGALATGSVFVAAVAFALLSSPQNRFASIVIGDEPKYLRYCEVFYQGRGFSFTNLRPIEQLPEDHAFDPGWIPETLYRTLRTEAANLVADARRVFQRGMPETFNRAGPLRGWTIEGKNGLGYQIHNPGLSILMFPAYYVDRAYLSPHSRFHDQFPSYLVVTQSFLLFLYGLWALAAFRLLRNYPGDVGTSLLLVLAVFVTVPVSPFNYQYYPEAVAGLFLLVLIDYLSFSEERKPGGAVVRGLLVGYLPWLHLRFLLPCAVLVAWAVVALRRDRKVLVSFLTGAVAPLLAMALYLYHVTGSFLPTAMYDAKPGFRGFRPEMLPAGLRGYAFDALYGILPYSPILLLCLPGIWRFLRERPREFAACAALASTVVLPAAGHVVWFGGTSTPSRLVVAVVPLALLSLAHTVEACRRNRLFWAVLGLLLVISVHNSFVYNSSHLRNRTGMFDASVSGWKSTLAFPSFVLPSAEQRASNGTLLVVWLAICFLLLLAPLWTRVVGDRARRLSPRSWAGALLVAVVMVGASASLLTRLAPRDHDPRYRVGANEARAELLSTLVDSGCGVCATTSQGLVSAGFLKQEVFAREYRFGVRAELRSSAGRIVRGGRAGAGALLLAGRADPSRPFFNRAVGGLVPGAHDLVVHGRTFGASPAPVLDVVVMDVTDGATLARQAIPGRRLFSSGRFRISFELPSASSRIRVHLYHRGEHRILLERLVVAHR